MQEILRQISNLPMNWLSIIDIIIVAVIIYQILIQFKGTRAMTLLNGLLILAIVTYLAALLNLQTLSWALTGAWAMMAVALPVVFQPELRRTLERLGRQSPLNIHTHSASAEEMEVAMREIVKTVKNLSDNRIGALIVLEKNTGIQEYIDTGLKIEGSVSAELLLSIFMPSTPLHDGAAIIRGARVMAAGCFLPLSQNTSLQQTLGTRHRAALGLSEVCDALIIIVSEETGIITTAQHGQIKRSHDEKSLRDALRNEFMVDKKEDIKKDFMFWK
ncbi:MAG: diadenylate cyclase CdaA [Peptococcaceae bacterium]|nr:diadenylate cyclase CdaA [Peptococcaceae bacterium]